MDASELYLQLPSDLSGAMSKNRFRNELLWGMEKLFEVYPKVDDFAIVFDYVCDIEVHVNNSFEFYQIKKHTSKDNYTIDALCKLPKSGHSIFGKLYWIRETAKSKDDSIKIKIAFVSNVPLHGKNKNRYKQFGETRLSMLSDACKESFQKYLSNEFSSERIDLEDAYYIRTPVNIINPESECIGICSKFFRERYKHETPKTLTLYNTIKELIEEKANYELPPNSYANLVETKGITKKEIDDLLDKFRLNTDNAMQQTLRHLNEPKLNYGEAYRNQVILSDLIAQYIKSRELKYIETKIHMYIQDNIEALDKSLDDLAEILVSKLNSIWPTDYSHKEKHIFTIFSLMKLLESGHA